MAKKNESDEEKEAQNAKESDATEDKKTEEQQSDKQQKQDQQQKKEQAEQKQKESQPQQPKEVTMNLNPYALFIVGLILGLAVALLLPTGTGGTQDNQDNTQDTKNTGGISASEAGTQVKQYISDNSQAFRLPPTTSISVNNTERLSNTPLYAVDLQIEAQIQNRTASQQISAHITDDGNWLFLQSQPLDTSKPVQEQIQQQAPQQPPQQPPQPPTEDTS